jgi:signal peptidase II
MPKIVYKLLWLVLGAGLLVGVDQAIKSLVWSVEIMPSIGVIGAIQRYRWWTHHPNYGISFGIELPYALSVGLMVVFLLILLWLLFQRGTRHSLMIVGLIFSIAGGVSNLVDRVSLGFVRDFIALAPWLPIFNVADVFVVGGVLLIFWGMYRRGRA